MKNVLVLLSMISMALTAATGSAGAKGASCRLTLPSEGGFLFPTSGVWLPETDNYVVVDVYRNSLFSLIGDASLLLEASGFPLGWPQDIRKRESSGEVFVQWRNRDLDPGRQVLIYTAEATSGGVIGAEPFLKELGDEVRSLQESEVKIGSIFEWAPFAEGILAFAAYMNTTPDGKKNAEAGFVYIDEQGGLQTLSHAVSLTSQAFLQYIRTTPYIAVVVDDPEDGNPREHAFILLRDSKELKLVAVDQDLQWVELSGFPEEFTARPEFERLSGLQGPREELLAYKKMEQSTMAVSLHSQSGRLYLLAKGGMTPEGTRWQIIELEKQSGFGIRTYVLPTRAAHLKVIPGDTVWALIEQGPVREAGTEDAAYFDSQSVLLLSNDWFQGQEGDLGPMVEECRVAEGTTTLSSLSSLLVGSH